VKIFICFSDQLGIRNNKVTVKMSIDAHERCTRVLRNLRLNCIQDPEVVLTKELKTVGLDSDYLKSNPELFDVFRRNLYRRLARRFHELVELIVSAHFIWQINTMLIMIKRRLTDDKTYEQVRKAILTPQSNGEYDYLTALKGQEYNSETADGNTLSSKYF